MPLCAYVFIVNHGSKHQIVSESHEVICKLGLFTGTVIAEAKSSH